MTNSLNRVLKQDMRGIWGALGFVLRSPKATIGLLIVIVIVLFAVVPDRWAPYKPNEQFLQYALMPPFSRTGNPQSHMFILGTDQLGRDIHSRVIYSARTSVIIGLTAVFISGLIGVTLGLLAGYRGGLVDDILMRVADIQLAFPFILLAIAVIGVLGNSIHNIILVVGIANWVIYARVVRGETLSVRERAYVEAARTIGASSIRIVLRHILPNVSASIIVIATFGVASTIITEAGLSFLGLGVPLHIPSWGAMLADGRRFVDTSWWLAVFPGIAIFLTVLAINLLGDYLRDVLDPYVQMRRTLQQQ